MKILEDGRYQLDDGRILTQEEVASLHKKAPSAKLASKSEEKDSLEEGQSSGTIRLED